MRSSKAFGGSAESWLIERAQYEFSLSDTDSQVLRHCGVCIARDLTPAHSWVTLRLMIKSFRHKGLRRLFETGNHRGVRPDHVRRLKLILARLDASQTRNDMDLPGLGLHPLKGDLRGYWAVTVSGNWRVFFRFENSDAVDVDYDDYH